MTLAHSINMRCGGFVPRLRATAVRGQRRLAAVVHGLPINRLWYSPLALSFFLMATPAAWAKHHKSAAAPVASSGGGGSGSPLDSVADFFYTMPKEWIVIGLVVAVIAVVIIALKGTDCNCRCGLSCKCKCRCGSTCQCMAKQINHF
jgi:hypothetical protein